MKRYCEIKQLVVILIVGLFLSGFLFATQGSIRVVQILKPEAPPQVKLFYKKIGLPEALIALHSEKASFLDLRDKQKFEQGHIPGAINISPDKILNSSEGLEGLAPKEIWVLYGDGVGALELAARQLGKSTSKEILVYNAGIKEWSSCKLPISKL